MSRRREQLEGTGLAQSAVVLAGEPGAALLQDIMPALCRGSNWNELDRFTLPTDISQGSLFWDRSGS